MHRSRGQGIPVLIAMCLSGPLAWAASADRPATLSGFTAEETRRELALEQRFDAQLNPADLRAWMQQMSSEPNHVGSPHDKQNAEFVRDQFRQWGWSAEIETFEVLYPTLKHHALELVGPTHFTASLREPPVEGDATSTRTDGLLPYHAYGGDGDVTAELVYVNYGMPDDYKELARRGVDVRGKIVIVRYGAGWRGLKPKLAYEHGAVGCLIYSDPKDDGYAAGDVYPKGGWRPADGVQRGSVMDMPVYPGDPLTPGIGATKNAKRLKLADAKTVLKIPVMPISYADAQPLLQALGGPVAPESWRGSLPITYHVGAGAAKVHLEVTSDWSLKTLYDVIARIPGSELPDEWVLRGNHRDGWVFGAWDPLSGHGAMLAEAKAIGMLLKDGWKPRRTIVYASWDGEEPGLLGSTEWAEAHAAELQRKAVLYLNSDTNARGFAGLGGSHTLQHFVNEVTAGINDPETGVSVRDRLRAHMLVAGNEKGASENDKRIAKEVREGADLPLYALGSGSDFSAFLQHIGIATLVAEYGGEDDEDGIYHSKYDSFDHYVRFGDPGFAYGIVEAQTAGRIVLRMSGADVLPMQFGEFSQTISQYLEELHKLTDDKREKSVVLAKLIDGNAFKLDADPTRVIQPPAREPDVPFLDFAPLDNAVARLKIDAKAYDDAFTALAAHGYALDAAHRAALDASLQGFEQTLLDPRGLPGRDWYKHLIYAPGLLTGYGVKTLPGVREAIDDNRWDQANTYIAYTAARVNASCERLENAVARSMSSPSPDRKSPSP